MNIRLSSMIFISLIGHSAMLWMPVANTQNAISSIQESVPKTIQVSINKYVKPQPKTEKALLEEIVETAEIVNETSDVESNLVESDVPPSITKNTSPRYPKIAQRRGYEGTVVLNIEVLENGKCGNISILESSGHDILDKSAISAVKRWQFTPASKNGLSIKESVELPISFKLNQT